MLKNEILKQKDYNYNQNNKCRSINRNAESVYGKLGQYTKDLTSEDVYQLQNTYHRSAQGTKLGHQTDRSIDLEKWHHMYKKSWIGLTKYQKLELSSSNNSSGLIQSPKIEEDYIESHGFKKKRKAGLHNVRKKRQLSTHTDIAL